MTTQNQEVLAPAMKPRQLSFTLPKSPDTKVYLHVSNLANCLFVVISGGGGFGAPATGASLGNLVYSLPDRLNPTAMPISTTLYSLAGSLDFITRLAKVLVKRAQRPVYVGGDIRLWEKEDESAALRGCVEAILGVIHPMDIAKNWSMHELQQLCHDCFIAPELDVESLRMY